MQARFHARPCNLWVTAAGSSTFCTACSRYSIGTTSNAMPPMHASRCNGTGCDFGNGLVSPTNPLTYDGRLLQQSGNWDECGASYTGGAVPVSGAVETTAPTSPATVCRSSSASSSSTSTATLEAESALAMQSAARNVRPRINTSVLVLLDRALHVLRLPHGQWLLILLVLLMSSAMPAALALVELLVTTLAAVVQAVAKKRHACPSRGLLVAALLCCLTVPSVALDL
ncbi:hypothetical protein Sste5346_004675 [Sporothrix stenoceras]|uniref:Uncharacterized protein n=1 Tax=Sporothrix stenoceras TaxID=5173 RepID=A0ABR3Z7Y7_9PEZI